VGRRVVLKRLKREMTFVEDKNHRKMIPMRVQIITRGEDDYAKYLTNGNVILFADDKGDIYRHGQSDPRKISVFC
jgi:hypothetical protein